MGKVLTLSPWNAGARFRFAVLAAMLLLVAGCDSVEERVEKHFERGLELIAEGNDVKAMLEFRNALQLDENHIGSHFELGKIQEARGNIRPAFKRFRKVADLDPGHVEARIKTARYFLLVDQPEDAELEIEGLLALAPDRPEVHALDAAAAMKFEEFERADQAIKQAEALDPDHIDTAMMRASYLYQTGDTSGALDRVNVALDLVQDKVSLYILKLQLLEKLDNQAAIGTHLTEMTERFPDRLQFRQALARWALGSGDLVAAEAQLRILADQAGEDPAPMYALVRFLRRHQSETAARDEIVSRIGQAEDPFQLQLMLAQFDVETGETDQAIADLRRLADTSDQHADKARVVLARLLLSRGNAGEAYALVDEVLANDATNVDALVMRIARQIERDNLEQAVGTVRDALDQAPDDTRLLLLAGRAQELSGNLDLANDRLASAVRSAKYDPDTVEKYVQFLLRSVRFTAAETVLSEAIRRNSESARLIDLLGFTRLRLGNWAGAEQAARALDGLNPERARQLRAAILIGQERFDEGASMLRDALPEDERTRAASVSALVQTYVRDGRTDQAVEFLDKMIAEDPENIQAIGLRGNLHLAGGEFEDAEASFRRILAIAPANGGAHSALARLFTMQGEEEVAEQQILRGLELSPDNLILLARLAQYREVQGRYGEAIEVYERLYERVPDSLLVANNLASLLSDHQADEPEALDRAYQIASRLRPSDQPQYRDTYGWTRYLKGEYEEALERIEPVAEALPNNPWVRYHLGMVYAKLNQADKARPHLQAALDLTAGSPFPPAAIIETTLADLAAQ